MDKVIDSLSKLIGLLSQTSWWLLLCFSFACLAFLYAPSLGGGEIGPIRRQFAPWASFAFWVFLILAIGVGLNSFVAWRESRKSLTLIYRLQSSSWQQAEQADGSIASWAFLVIDVTNNRSTAIRVVRAELLSPEVHQPAQISASMLFDKAEVAFDSIPAGASRKLNVQFRVGGPLGVQGKPLSIVARLTDQNGVGYRVSCNDIRYV